MISRPALNCIGQIVDLLAPPGQIGIDLARPDEKDVDIAFGGAIPASRRTKQRRLHGLFLPTLDQLAQSSEQLWPQISEGFHRRCSQVVSIQRVDISATSPLLMNETLIHQSIQNLLHPRLGSLSRPGYFPPRQWLVCTGQRGEHCGADGG